MRARGGYLENLNSTLVTTEVGDDISSEYISDDLNSTLVTTEVTYSTYLW